MNDDNKDPNSKAAGAPNDADDNPWDEDDGGGRTLATDGPSFELPSNIPSPITVPPPAIPKAPAAPGVRPRSPTMMGFGPMGPPLPLGAPAAPAAPARPIGAIAPAPKSAGAPASSRGMPVAPRVGAPLSSPTAPTAARPAAPRVGGAGGPPSAPLPLPSARGKAPAAPPPRAPAPAPAPIASSDPPPAAKVEEPWEDDDSNHDDGPTMAGAPLMPDAPLRDDVVNPRLGDDVVKPRPQSPLASTGYQPGRFGGNGPTPPDDDGDIEPIGGAVGSEETTRAVSREELMGHQNAQVVLGDDDDAHGDEATLAVAPGALAELGIDPGMAAALAEREARGTAPHGPSSSPAFPPPPPFASQGGPGAAHAQLQQPPSQPQIPSWQGEAAPSYRNPPAQPMGGGMGMPQGYDPLVPQGYDPLVPQGYQSSPGMQGAPQAQGYPMQGGGYAHNPQGTAQPMPGQQWMQAAPQGSLGLAKKLTPQVIMLIVVGAVCLSIFVIGIVLFVTTNFQPRP